jgi:hypothetical protein
MEKRFGGLRNNKCLYFLGLLCLVLDTEVQQQRVVCVG